MKSRREPLSLDCDFCRSNGNFADFFYLLLSFAKTDLQKFKTAANSIRGAFGGVPSHLFYGKSPMKESLEGQPKKGVGDALEVSFSSLSIPLEAKEICELEQQKRTRKRSHTEYLKYQIEKYLLGQLEGEEGVHIGVERGRVRVRFFQDQLFEGKTALLYRDKLDLFRRLFLSISEEKLEISKYQRLQIGITNYSKPRGNSPADFKRWKLSTERSLALAYITGQIKEAAIHDIKVESWSSYEGDKGDEGREVIDLFISASSGSL